MVIGYARVSTADQNLDLQSDAFTKAGCEKIFSDIVSGSKSEREGLTKALSQQSVVAAEPKVQANAPGHQLQPRYPIPSGSIRASALPRNL